MRTPTGHSPRQRAPCDHGVSRWLDWMISRSVFQPQLLCGSRISWRVRGWPLQTLWDAGFTVQPNQQPTGLPSHVRSVWPSEAPGRSQEWLPKRPSPGSFSLERSTSHQNTALLCQVLAAIPSLVPAAAWAEVLGWAQPACPGTALPPACAQEGSWDGAAGGTCCLDPSRKHHPGVPSAGSWLCSHGSSCSCPGTGFGLSPPFPGWLGMPLPRAWGSLCQTRAGWFYTTWSSLKWEITGELLQGKCAFHIITPSCYSMEPRNYPRGSQLLPAEWLGWWTGSTLQG